MTTHQASQVVVAVRVLPPETDGVPVALLCLLELPQAVLNDPQVHPGRSKVRPGRNAYTHAAVNVADTPSPSYATLISVQPKFDGGSGQVKTQALPSPNNAGVPWAL